MISKCNLLGFIHRKRRAAGFGVHSPFAFKLILDTIHTPHSYYIYEENKTKLYSARLKKETNLKYAELLFRLINRFNANNILEIGSGQGIYTLYLSAHSKQSTVVCVEQDQKKQKRAQLLLGDKLENIILTNVLPTKENIFDAIVWDLDEYQINKEDTLKYISSRVGSGGLLILNHINKGKQNKEVWQKAIQIDTITMSFDLGTIGIAFFKPSLPKQNYCLYF